ncbi:MAG: low temperature requirement protein A [Alphaproteobacteria bacterium]|nr:MAG: low temperature requirement protein A [Alphaproteobacteria bacterium]
MPFISPLRPRDMTEAHRAATPLELLYDLVSVIAIAAAAAGLHHAIAEAHYLDGIIKFLAVFFGIWWAWMNYTWFASAYDNDDAAFRLLTMAIMGGALVMASGVAPFFTHLDFRLIVAGFVIMRLAMVVLWLRAAAQDGTRRRTALSYAIGITIAQVCWTGLLLAQGWLGALFFPLYGLCAVIELMVPVLAERQGTTPWHRHHMIERYGLLNIIVLGETLLAGSMALGRASGPAMDWHLVGIAAAALVIVFALWWLYFAREDHLEEHKLSRALSWGYGHLLVYVAGAAVGAGFAALVDISAHQAHAPLIAGLYGVAVPVALYFVGLWFVRDRIALGHTHHWVLPAFAALILAVPPFAGIYGIAALTILAVHIRARIACPAL